MCCGLLRNKWWGSGMKILEVWFYNVRIVITNINVGIRAKIIGCVG
jgi:hypothetical protein